jgi:transcription antitermination factor NusG
VSTSAWYAVRVKSRHEKSVAAALEAREIEHLLPLHVNRRKWADRYKNVSLPLFPGYVFSLFDFENRGPLLRTPGVIDVVRFGTVALPVDPQEIDALRTLMACGLPSEPYAQLAVGQRVDIVSGPFFGKSGVVLRIGNQRRLALSVTLLNRSVLVDIEHDWVVSSGKLIQPHALGTAVATPIPARPHRDPDMGWESAGSLVG